MLNYENKVNSPTNYLRNYWPNLLTIFSTLGLTASSVLQSIEKGEWQWNSETRYAFILIVSLSLSLVGQLIQLLQSPAKRSLESELNKAIETINSIKSSDFIIIRNELIILSEILGFGSSERISIYGHNSENSNFVMICRFSKNPDYDKKGRGIHPDDKGVMGAAWREGKAFVDDLPKCNGNDDFDYLRETEINWGIDRHIAQKFSMKSRTFGSYSIEDKSGKKAFVIVFESMNPHGFTMENLDDIMSKSKERRRFSLLLDQLKNVTPNPNSATKEGF